MRLDENCPDIKGYRVRSLYFDSTHDECLYQKQSGFKERSKIRLRTYGNSDQAVKFEIKNKNGQLVNKESVTIDRQYAEDICAGNYNLLLKHKHPLLDRIYGIFMSGAYKPKVIVEYKRTAFVLPVSNVRITFDQDLHSNINHLDLFSNVKDTVPIALEGKQILEVKYDQFVPGYIRKMLSGMSTERMAISKYTLARRFHKIQKWEDN